DVKSTDAAAYQLAVHDQSSPITVGIKNANTLAVAVGDVTIGQNATIELGTAGNVLDSGTLATPNSQSVIIQDGGSLKGNGVVATEDLIVTNGTIAPGYSVGHLSVAGDYQQGANSTLKIDVEGAAANQFDTVAISGAAVLGGTLRIDAA